MSDFLTGFLVGVASTVGVGVVQLAWFAWLAPVETGRPGVEDGDGGEDDPGPPPSEGPVSRSIAARLAPLRMGVRPHRGGAGVRAAAGGAAFGRRRAA